MFIEIKGKAQVIEDLERADKLIREAQHILYGVPPKLKIEVIEGNDKASDSDQDNQ